MAARLLSAVVDKQTSLDGLTDAHGGQPRFRALDPRDQSLVKAIVVTALRHRGSIQAALDARLDRPLPAKAARLKHILHVAAAQILHLDVPASAAVDCAVESARADPASERFAGLVNAVLRALARAKDAGDVAADDPMADCPDWLAERLVAQYGAETARAIAAAHRVPAPIDLTVPRDIEGWQTRLGGRIVATTTLRLVRPEPPLVEWPGYAEGAWWVQDAAAALPAKLFGDVSGLRVADLCAAPGGKTAQLAACGARVTALDSSANRLKRLSANLDRLGLSAEIVQARAEDYAPAEPFAAVLLDAPCSSTGTLRRHPDVGYTKDAAEIDKLAGVQARLLTAAAALTAPGGTLVFSNCSLDRAEGEAVVEAFLANHPAFVRRPVEPAEIPDFATAVTDLGDLRTTPAMLGGAAPDGGCDGFFAARLVRAS